MRFPVRPLTYYLDVEVFRVEVVENVRSALVLAFPNQGANRADNDRPVQRMGLRRRNHQIPHFYVSSQD